MDAHQPTDIDFDFDAILSLAQAQAAEHNERFILARRVTLLALTKNRAELVDSVRQVGSEAFAAWLEHIEAFQAELRSLLELSASAHARLLAAGQLGAEERRPH